MPLGVCVVMRDESGECWGFREQPAWPGEAWVPPAPHRVVLEGL